MMDQSFEAVLVRQCAPTLAGMKPGSLFCYRGATLDQCRRKAEQWEERLSPLGLSVSVLLERPAQSSAIIYVYRHSHLSRVLSTPCYRDFLAGMGYRGSGVADHLACLADRLGSAPEFPHEIGVFLGYPLRDVVGFIENRGQNFTCCGLWKAYGDPVATRRCFDCYRRCVDCYLELYRQGIPIEQLAVAI